MIRLDFRHKKLIDLVIDGSTYPQASREIYPKHSEWDDNKHNAFVSRIINSAPGKAYYTKRLAEIDELKSKELSERYKNPAWSFDDSVQHLRLIINLAKEELSMNREKFRQNKVNRIMSPTCVNALLSAISMLNKMYRYDINETIFEADSRRNLEQEILRLKSEKERLELEKQIIQLDREKGEICYNDVAVSEFSKVIKVVYDSVVRIPTTLSNENDFTIEQKATIMKVVESILESLSNVRVELSSANTIDKKLSEMSSHASKASKKKQVQK